MWGRVIATLWVGILLGGVCEMDIETEQVNLSDSSRYKMNNQYD